MLNRFKNWTQNIRQWFSNGYANIFANKSRNDTRSNDGIAPTEKTPPPVHKSRFASPRIIASAYDAGAHSSAYSAHNTGAGCGGCGSTLPREPRKNAVLAPLSHGIIKPETALSGKVDFASPTLIKPSRRAFLKAGALGVAGFSAGMLGTCPYANAIVGGSEHIPAEFEGVSQIGIFDADSKLLGTCDAAFVSATTAITSCICLRISRNTRYIAINSRSLGVVKTTNFHTHPNCIADYEDMRHHDIGVIIFDKPVYRSHLVKIAPHPVRQGERITMVGHGENEYSVQIDDQGKKITGPIGQGVRRMGTNTVSRITRGFIFVRATYFPSPTREHNASLGTDYDDGNPIFSSQGLVGIKAGKFADAQDNDTEMAFTSIHNDYFIDFLHEKVRTRGADIPNIPSPVFFLRDRQ